jgi:hypothetical protein
VYRVGIQGNKVVSLETMAHHPNIETVEGIILPPEKVKTTSLLPATPRHDEMGNLIEVYQYLSGTTDKKEIVADGVDTATITATTDDPNSTEMIEFVNGTEVYQEQAVNGVATFQVTMTVPGELKLIVRSTTKYGQQEIVIKGVSA